MSKSCNNGNNDNNNDNGTSFLRHIREFVGETVTIFTTSGGASGCGFTGIILSVDSGFVRLVIEQGMAPTNPLAENICGDYDGNGGRGGCGGDLGGSGGYNGRSVRDRNGQRNVGSVVDIPIDRISAFCHNAV